MLDAFKAVGMLLLMPFYGVYYAVSAVLLPGAWVAAQHTWISPILAFAAWKGFTWAFTDYGKKNPSTVWASRRLYAMVTLALTVSAWASILLAMPAIYREGGDMYRDPGEVVDVETKSEEQRKIDSGSNMICIGIPALAVAISNWRKANPKP